MSSVSSVLKKDAKFPTVYEKKLGERGRSLVELTRI